MAAVLLTASIANVTASIACRLCSAEAATMTLASLTGTILLMGERKIKTFGELHLYPGRSLGGNEATQATHNYKLALHPLAAPCTP